jgi:hypothetical protein
MEPMCSNAPGARMSVDLYRPGWAERRLPLSLSPPRWGPPWAIMTSLRPTQGGHFTIRGPSTTGPWTYRGPWNFGVGGIGTAGQGLGLT